MVKRELILAVVVVVVLAVSGGYYFVNVSNTNSANTTTVTIIGSHTRPLRRKRHPASQTRSSPTILPYTQGQHVTLVFENEDDGPHQLVIPGYGVNTGIVQGGQTVRVNFVANQAGIFPLDPAGGRLRCRWAYSPTGRMHRRAADERQHDGHCALAVIRSSRPE